MEKSDVVLHVADDAPSKVITDLAGGGGIVGDYDDDVHGINCGGVLAHQHLPATSAGLLDGSTLMHSSRRRKVLWMATCGVFAVLLLAGSLLVALALTGAISLGGGGHQNPPAAFRTNGEQVELTTQQAPVAGGEISATRNSFLSDNDSDGRYVRLKQRRGASELLDFSSYRVDTEVKAMMASRGDIVLEQHAAADALVVTVNTNYTNYVLFESLFCRGTFFQQNPASSPSTCGQRCDENGECQAWTFTDSSPTVCQHFHSCPVLASPHNGTADSGAVVTGIKRHAGEVIVVRIEGREDNYDMKVSSDADDDDDSVAEWASSSTHDHDDDAAAWSSISAGSSMSDDTSTDDDSAGRDNDDDDSAFDISSADVSDSASASSWSSMNATTWILFENMACSGHTYQSMTADQFSNCSDWCASMRECSAWTYSQVKGGRCDFKRGCSELTETGAASVSAIKREGDEATTVGIIGNDDGKVWAPGDNDDDNDDDAIQDDDDDTGIDESRDSTASDNTSWDDDSDDTDDSANDDDGESDWQPVAGDDDDSG